jgi:tetratricopeptide (TPR) repeat protein
VGRARCASKLNPVIAIAAALVFAGVACGCAELKVAPQTLMQRAVRSADSGDDRGAIAAYGELLRLQPGNADAAYLRGAAYDRLGDRSSALADYDQALRLNAELLPAYLARAAVHAALGSSAAAQADRLAARRLLRDDQQH